MIEANEMKKGSVNLTTNMLLGIVVVLIILVIALYAVATAGGMSLPLFDQIDKMLRDLFVPGG